MSRHELGRLTARAWDLEMSADVGQQLTVPPETVSSSSLGPEQALQSDTQRAVYLGGFKMICNISWFALFRSGYCETTAIAEKFKRV